MLARIIHLANEIFRFVQEERQRHGHTMFDFCDFVVRLLDWGDIGCTEDELRVALRALVAWGAFQYFPKCGKGYVEWWGIR